MPDLTEQLALARAAEERCRHAYRAALMSEEVAKAHTHNKRAELLCARNMRIAAQRAKERA